MDLVTPQRLREQKTRSSPPSEQDQIKEWIIEDFANLKIDSYPLRAFGVLSIPPFGDVAGYH